MDDALARLAAKAGLFADYWDISGQHHVTKPETARSLLAALGLPTGSDSEVRQSLETWEARSWERNLPPVMVIREDEALKVPVVLHASEIDEPLRWTVYEESGAEIEGEARPSDLAVIAAPHESAGHSRRLLALDIRLPCGYHRLSLETRDKAEMSLIVAPRKAYLPLALRSGERLFGLTAQLYSLRSESDWGIGDFGDLADLASWTGRQGGATIVLNPLHALFMTDPESASPYFASSRLFLNPIYLAIEEIRDFTECDTAKKRLTEADAAKMLDDLRKSRSVDYEKVSDLKREILEMLFASFREKHMRRTGDRRAIEFHKFRAHHGETLKAFALFETLAENFGTPAWRTWPEGFHGPHSPDARAFERDHPERIEFFEYLQWQGDFQLRAAAKAGRDGGMEIGLCRDLAVACPTNGADGWRYGDVYVEGARLGAPPDAFNPAGQEWGIAPMHPHRLRDLQYRPFIDLLRANMCHAGALRIDHVMWIARQFWVPAGGSPADGTYIHFPFDDLLGMLALESQRNRCMVIGEDLGTVPENFRERMADADIFSSRVLYFESDHGRFRSPGEFPRLAAASVTTHDLPTLKGFWSGADLKERHQLGLFPSPEIERRSAESRHWDIANLMRALREAGLLPEGFENPDWSEDIWRAVHAFLARTSSALALVQIDDLTDEEIQVNLPGTSDDQRANWRRRLSKGLREIASDPVIKERMDVIANGRRPVRPPSSS